MAFTAMTDVPNPIFDSNGDPFSGAVLKAFLPGTTTSTSIFIDSSGSSPQTSVTANAKGIWEVTGNAIVPYIDREHKWGIFANAADAANNTPFYMGPFDDVEQTSTPTSSDGRYSAVFGSIASMLTLTPVDGVTYVPVSGQSVFLTSYFTSIPFSEPQGGGGHFRVMTLAEYVLTPDEVGAAFTIGGFAFVREFNIEVNGKDFGMVSDGVDTGSAFTGTDNTASFQAAIDHCGTNRLKLHISAGNYRFANNTSDNTGTILLNNLYHLIEGYGAVFFIDDDAPSVRTALDFIRTPNIDTSTNLDDRDYMGWFGITFKGRWSHSNTTGGPNVFNVQNFSRVEFNDCKAFDIRNKFSRSKFIGSLNVQNFEGERIASDCLRFSETSDVTMNNIRLFEIDDDSIALPVSPSDLSDSRQKITLANIILTKCEGILILGARSVAISNIVMRLCSGTSMFIGGKVGTEGVNSPFSVAINNISIIDPLNRADGGSNGSPPTALLTSLDAAIIISGIQPTDDSTTMFPGQWDSVQDHILRPYDLDDNSDPIFYNSGSSETIPQGYNYTVSNFTIMRTLPVVTNYSDWGFGLAFSRWGYFDPAVALDNFAENGVQLVGAIKNAQVSGGTVFGFGEGGAVKLVSAATAGTRDREFENILIADVTAKDCKYGVYHSATSAASDFTWGVTVKDCDFDLDTFSTSSARNDNDKGTWTSGVGIDDKPIGVYLRKSLGWTIDNCTFANCYDTILGGADFRDQSNIMSCWVKCDPNDTDFNASNKGVAVVPHAGNSFRYMIVHSEPDDDANYMRVKNICVTEALASALPTTGTYVHGHVIKVMNPSISAGKILASWARVNTGTAHVLNTDWAAQFTTTT